MKALFVSLFIPCLIGADPSTVENWPRFRGPNGNAVNNAQPLPTKWSVTKNIHWKTPIPGEGFSSPIIWKDRIFLTSAFEHGQRRATHCLDRTTGRILW